ncbi:hypothetical protein [Desulfoferrobacter suflitae]|uniref:hypothetical protein n=1 Tax=Desulfoferrobacter suflitae TaxID=2865782 RepID=UPI002164E3A1|nr:hypothetical protein [Desulfoferrobacter suflitae]MCK8603935.1 hypothetical protein [Desulfoferrobacter suflitae]
MLERFLLQVKIMKSDLRNPSTIPFGNIRGDLISRGGSCLREQIFDDRVAGGYLEVCGAEEILRKRGYWA